MRLRALIPAVAIVAVALALPSCSSDSTSPTSATSTTSGVSRALQTALRQGLNGVETAHFSLTGTVAGSALSGSGEQKLSGGKVVGLQASATLPGGIGEVALVVSGAERYVKVPPPFANAAKPWLRVTSSSSNVIVKQLAGVLDSALAAGDLGGLPDLVTAARTVRDVGTDAYGTHYALVVDPAKLPDHVAGSAALGSKPVPVDLWLDARQRPVRVHAAVSLAGQAADITVSFGDFGAPVTITTPPVSQIASG